MPNVLVEIRRGRSAGEKHALLDAIHSALVEALRVPDHDRTQRLREYAPEDLETPPGKSEKYTLIEITMFSGRSLEAKRRLYAALTSRLAELGTPATDVKIVLVEAPLESWGLRGRPASEIDLGFEVNV